jgi:hypothetical protein
LIWQNGRKNYRLAIGEKESFSYTSDILEALLALSEAGRALDPRLRKAFQLVISKRDAEGRWALKHTLNGKMVADVETRGQPSKWVTLRALRALKAGGYLERLT